MSWIATLALAACGADEHAAERRELEAMRAELEAEKRALRDERAVLEQEKRSGLRLNDIDPSVPSLVLHISAEGTIAIQGRTIADADLDDVFRRAVARDRNTQVILEAERGVGHGRVVGIMERAKLAGLTRLAIGTVDTPAP